MLLFPCDSSMFLLRQRLKLLPISSINDSKTKNNLYAIFLQKPSSFTSISHITNPPTTDNSSFTVSYLINSCGLSPESALSASSKRAILKNYEKPDAVLAFLKEHGFSDTHITKLISRFPPLLSANVDKTLKPKLDFFIGSGVTSSVMVKMISSNPSLLERSLTNQIIPSFNFLRSCVHTNENINAALRRSAQILQMSLHGKLLPNVNILRNHGVPESWIMTLITTHPRTLSLIPDQFSEIVKVVEGFGFDSSSSLFIIAVRVMSVISKSTWQRKLKVYMRVGWSEDEVLSAFKKQPLCMMISEEKIMKLVEFIVKELGVKASDICQHPNLLLLSFERRIVPRCGVIRVLMSRNLTKKNLSLISVMACSELDFLKKYVTKYQEVAPEVLMAYQGRRDLLGTDIGSEEGGVASML